MPSIQKIVPPFELPDGALCFTPTGWRHEAFEVVIKCERGTTLPQVMDALWQQNRGLLGEGELVFKQVEEVPSAKGFLVFLPSEN